jgi:uncharacterized protein YigA (DUF484 family)
MICQDEESGVSLDQERVDLERERVKLEENSVDLEKERCDLIRKRNQIEKTKTKIAKWSLCLSISIAVVSIAYGFWSLQKRATADFEVKAAEIILQAPNPEEALKRAEILHYLFPHRLSSDIPEKIARGYGISRPSTKK